MKKDLLGAADHLKWAFARHAELNSYLQTIVDAVQGPAGDLFAPWTWFPPLLDLNPTVVFTTNYDRLFETASLSGFATVNWNSSAGLGRQVRRGDPVLVKIHGSVDAPEDIILTQRDYARLQREGSGVLELLRALSLTETILFVGYRLGDPDIQLALRSIGPSLDGPEAHFLLGEKHGAASAGEVLKECFGTALIPFPSGNYASALSALEKLRDEVAAARKDGG
ncbi:MAG: SIR2 family NAD-dependent protein deacylase [Candidatus Dormibacteria bacterium]